MERRRPSCVPHLDLEEKTSVSPSMSTLLGRSRRLRSLKSREAEARLYSFALASFAANAINLRQSRSPPPCRLTIESGQPSASKEKEPSQVDGRTLIPPNAVRALQEGTASEVASPEAAPTTESKVSKADSEKVPPWEAAAHDAASVLASESDAPEMGHKTAAAKKVACSVPLSCVRVSKRPRLPNSPTACGSTASVLSTRELMAKQSAKKTKVWFELVNTLEFDYKLTAIDIGKNRHNFTTAQVNEVAPERRHPYREMLTIKEKEKEAKQMQSLRKNMQPTASQASRQSPRTNKQPTASMASPESPSKENEPTASPATRQSTRTKKQPTASLASRQSQHKPRASTASPASRQSPRNSKDAATTHAIRLSPNKNELIASRASRHPPHTKDEPSAFQANGLSLRKENKTTASEASEDAAVTPSNLSGPEGEADSAEAVEVNEPATLAKAAMLLVGASFEEVSSPVSVPQAASVAIKEDGTAVDDASMRVPPKATPGAQQDPPKNPPEETAFALKATKMQKNPHQVPSATSSVTFSLVAAHAASDTTISKEFAEEGLAEEVITLTEKCASPAWVPAVASTAFLGLVAGEGGSPHQNAALEATEGATVGSESASTLVERQVAVQVVTLSEEVTSPLLLPQAGPFLDVAEPQEDPFLNVAELNVAEENVAPFEVLPEPFASKEATLKETVSEILKGKVGYTCSEKRTGDESEKGVMGKMHVSFEDACMDIEFAEEDASVAALTANQLLPDKSLELVDKVAKKREYDREYRKNRKASQTAEEKRHLNADEAARKKRSREDFKENGTTPEKEWTNAQTLNRVKDHRAKQKLLNAVSDPGCPNHDNEKAISEAKQLLLAKERNRQKVHREKLRAIKKQSERTP